MLPGKKDLRAAKWVTPYFQRKAFSEAWLAFFRLQIPEDVFKKVPACSVSHIQAFPQLATIGLVIVYTRLSSLQALSLLTPILKAYLILLPTKGSLMKDSL